MLYEELPSMLEQEALSDALADERKTLLELELANDEALQEPKEGKRKKRLKRELVREALTRLEESARSENEFREVVQFWDRLEENEVRRVGNHETLRGDIPLEWDTAEAAGGEGQTGLVPYRCPASFFAENRKTAS